MPCPPSLSSSSLLVLLHLPSLSSLHFLAPFSLFFRLLLVVLLVILFSLTLLWLLFLVTAGVEILPLIVRADTQGAVDALKAAVAALPSDDVEVKVVASGLGAVTDGDIKNASMQGASILAFGAQVPAKLEKEAESMEL